MKPPLPGISAVAPSTEVPKNEVMAPGEMLDFPTPRDLQRFQLMRKSGNVTWWRTRKCNACETEVPNAFRFCSEPCYHKLHPPPPKTEP